MARINIYRESDDRSYVLNVDAHQQVIKVKDDDTLGEIDFYLRLETNMPKNDGTSHPVYIVRTEADTPPGYGPEGP